MKFNIKRMFVALAVVIVLGSASGFAGSAAPSTMAAPEQLTLFLSGQASRLLAEVQDEAAALELNAEVLGTLNPTITWHSHASYLIEVKRHINTIGARLEELQRIRPALPGWQQQAIAEVYGHAFQVAASTEAAITHLRENQDRVFAPEYQGHLRTIMGSSENLKQSVDKFLEYQNAQQKFQQLQRGLEL